MTDYTGPERRKDTLDWSDKMGRWFLDHAGVMAAAVLIHFVILAFVALGVLLVQRNSNDQIDSLKRTAQDTNQVASFLEDCLLKKAELTPAEQAQRCGPDSSGNIVKGLVTYMNCAFLIQPADRTEINLTACALKGFGGSK